VSSSVLYTIGYQGRALDELVAMLRSHAIDRVIDIRELPLSRREGSDPAARAAREISRPPEQGAQRRGRCRRADRLGVELKNLE